MAAGSGVQITLATSSLPPQGVDDPSGGGGIGGLDPIEARITVEISEDSGTNWIQVWENYTPIAQQSISISVPNAATWDLLQIRITGRYESGQGALTFRVYEVSGSDGSSDEVDPGSYDYCLTEIYKDPGNREIESSPSDKFTVVVPTPDPGANPDPIPPTQYGIILNDLGVDVPAQKLWRR